MTPLLQRDIMTSPPLPAIATADDTFDTRWERWVAEGIRRDRIFETRAKIALVAVAWAVAIVTVWLVLI